MLMRSMRFKTIKEAITYKRRVQRLGYSARIHSKGMEIFQYKFSVFVERLDKHQSSFTPVSSYFQD